ncbi:predicted protein [Nematostella vectensis]|uniref:VTT domain-containing protein n=1 Tax=Nematostella vectensis TaxID=45351 RepID=A7RHV7_NEMVE|nr:transmembrane protein 41A-A [Nematostella vectensis]EDO48921.1 predicted protein [Nematostella vectensis]|eukprot:XP_001640984.1 predicted protein [Nematostella vectensis]
MADTTKRSVKTVLCVLCVLAIFSLASLYLYFLSKWLPPLAREMVSEDDLNSNTTNQRAELYFPSSIEELKALASILKMYKKENSGYVALLFCSAYLYKQTFAIPGSVFMNILAGAIFGIWKAFPLTCFLTACGASCCYLLSRTFGRSLLVQYFPERVAALQAKVHENLDRLFFFLLFLRLFPMSPNWFLNMTSPILDVPLPQFFVSVFIGLMPYNFLCCQTGCLLSQLKSLNDLFTASVMFKLAAMAFVAMVPGLVVKRLHKQHNKTK